MKKYILLTLLLGAVAFSATTYDIYDGQRMYPIKSKEISDVSKCKLIGDEENVYCLLPVTQEDIDNYLKTHDDCLGEYGCTLPDSDEPEDIWDLTDESGLTDLEKSIILNKIR